MKFIGNSSLSFLIALTLLVVW